MKAFVVTHPTQLAISSARQSRRRLLFACCTVLVIFTLCSPAKAGIVQVEACIDGKSELVLAPGGLYWHNIVNGWAKPGNYGVNYEITGPTYFDGQPWMPTWLLPDPRANDVSNVFPMDASGFDGFNLSPQYDHYFDSYPQDLGGTTLGSMIQLNRGPVTLSSYGGFTAICFDDGPYNGQNAYSIDLHFVDVPEPNPLGLIALAFVGFALRSAHRVDLGRLLTGSDAP
jgi:hypothetical protein